MKKLSGKMDSFKEIIRGYERLRWQKTAELRNRKAEVYKKVPRIKEIEEAVSLTGIRIARLVLKQPENFFQLAGKMQEEMTALRLEKQALLEANGFSEQYMEMEYVCQQCQDTGYVETQQCICMKQKLMDASYAQSNIRDIVKRENFDTFDIRFYSDVTDPNEGISPKENIQGILSICLRFAQGFEKEFTNLLLYGGTGLGKTFLCNCMAKEILDQGKTVLYVTAGQLFKMIEEQRFGKLEEEEKEDYMTDILGVDLFIIDDLGTEFSTILSSSELFNIINTRMLNKKPVILSTNLAPSDFVNQYSDRIVSRLLGEYQTLKFFGEDIRVKKKFLK